MWTIFRAEVAHFKTQHVAYRKTGLEWEILGDLGTRLHHKEEAKEAYQRCLDTPRYSVKPWNKLMEMYADEGDIQRCIQTAIRVAAYQYAEYTEMTVRFFGFIIAALGCSKVDAHTVPDANRQVFLQAGAGARTRQDLVYAAQHGPPGTDSQNYGQLLAVWQNLQGRRLRLLVPKRRQHLLCCVSHFPSNAWRVC